MQKLVHRHAVWLSPYGLPDSQPLRHLTDHQPSSAHSNLLQPTNRVLVLSWMFYHCEPDCVDLCSVDPETSLFSLLVIRRFLYLNLVEGIQISSQPYSGAALVFHSHDSRRCTGYANRYSRPAQPSPAQPSQRIRLWPIAHLTLAAAMSTPRPTGKLAVIKQPAATLYPPMHGSPPYAPSVLL